MPERSLDQNLEYYRTFAVVAQTGSFTKAAQQLHISQPAVSQKLQLLEENLGTKLFRRTARGVRLTSEGTLLYGYVSRALDQIELGERKLRQMLDLDIGELHIGASDMTLHFYLLPYLERFHEQHPQIKMAITNGPTPATIDQLAAGSIDFGVVSGPLDELLAGHPEMDAFSVREIQDIFVAGTQSPYRGLQGEQLPWHQLKELPLIFLEEKTASRRYIDRFLAKKGIVLHPEFELATSDMIVQFAQRNLGIGCVVEDFAKEALEDGALFALDFAEKVPERQFYIITNKEDYLPQAARELLQLIRKDQQRL